MTKPLSSRNWTRAALAALLGAALLTAAACGPVSDVIGRRNTPVPTVEGFVATPGALRTATPGGLLSVWVVTPSDGADQPGSAATPDPHVPGARPVGPAATATAAFATIEAATAIAAMPPPAPYYQPDDCPLPGVPVAPSRPASFNDYKDRIAAYLSAGGSPTVLEATLRNWGAITERGGMVQPDTDLTGDGVREIIVTLFNPQTYNDEALLNAGQLLVLGCDGGGYRVLYETPFNPLVALPELLRVGDMNADVRAELVFFTETCGRSSCYKDGKILTWNAQTGAFKELNNGQIVAINGRIGIADVDGDGVLELIAQINPPRAGGLSAPARVIDTWDWSGTDYVLALREDVG